MNYQEVAELFEPGPERYGLRGAKAVWDDIKTRFEKSQDTVNNHRQRRWLAQPLKGAFPYFAIF